MVERRGVAPVLPKCPSCEGRDQGDALEMLLKASERAASLGANEEAQRYAARAIELSDDPATTAELHERAGITDTAPFRGSGSRMSPTAEPSPSAPGRAAQRAS